MINIIKNMLSRRKFIKVAGLAAGAAAVAPKLNVFAANAPTADVALAALSPEADSKAVEAAVRRAVNAVTDFSWLKEGDTVVVKPASNSGNKFPYTTHPEGLRGMIKLLKEKGAGRVILVEQSGIQYVKRTENEHRGSSKKLLENNGLDQAAREAGAEILYPEDGDYDKYILENTAPISHWKKGFYLPEILKEADHIVLMPRVASHVLAGSTLGFKSAIGWLRNDSRLEYHRDADTFYEKTAEIHSAPIFRSKMRLIVSVANQVVTTFGPDHGHIAKPDVGLVIASDNLLAHDMAALAWLTYNYENNTPATAKLADPRKGPITTINRVLVKWLGGKEESKKAQKLALNSPKKVSEDKVIAYAAKLWGGAPRIQWVIKNENIPSAIIGEMSKKLA